MCAVPVSAIRGRGLPGLAWLGLLGVLGGALADVATLALSNSDIGGPGWSLRGNGALIVPLGVEPAMLAAGWAAVARSDRRDWLRTATLAGGIVLLLALGLSFGPIIVGPQRAVGLSSLMLILPVVLAAAGGLVLAGGGVRSAVAAAGVALGLGLLLPGLGYVVVPLLLPCVLAAPLIETSPRRRTLQACAALLVGLLIGTLGGQVVLTRM